MVNNNLPFKIPINAHSTQQLSKNKGFESDSGFESGFVLSSRKPVSANSLDAHDLELRFANKHATSLPGDDETEYSSQQRLALIRKSRRTVDASIPLNAKLNNSLPSLKLDAFRRVKRVYS